jgi:hypothetical protein
MGKIGEEVVDLGIDCNTTMVPMIEAIKIGRQVMYMYESFLL